MQGKFHTTCEGLAVHGPSMGLMYLASPLTHADPLVRFSRQYQARRHTKWLIKKGVNVFSPIAYTAAIGLNDLPFDWNYWGRMCLEQVAAAQAVLVLMIPGWDTSVGVTAEIAHARKLRKPVWYLQPLE